MAKKPVAMTFTDEEVCKALSSHFNLDVEEVHHYDNEQGLECRVDVHVNSPSDSRAFPQKD